MISDAYTNITNDKLLLLREQFKFIDSFILEFARVQGNKFRNNISKIEFSHTLDKSNAFKDTQKFYYDELSILLCGWGKLYNFKDIIKDNKNKDLIPLTKEMYAHDFNFFEIIDSLILSGCPAILIKDEDDIIEVVNKIKTVKLISQIFDSRTTILVKTSKDYDIFNRCLIYSKLADIVWIETPNFDEILARKLKTDIDYEFSQKILGYKYHSNDEKINKTLESLGYSFSDIEPGWIPTARLEFI